MLQSKLACGIELHLKLSVVSSAYKTGVKTFEILGKSFMKNKKSRGPRTDPCGTPFDIGRGGDIDCLIRTD